MHLQYWLLWRRIQLHRYPSVLFRFLDRDLMKSPDQAIMEEVQCLDLLQLFHTNIDGLVHLISFWL